MPRAVTPTRWMSASSVTCSGKVSRKSMIGSSSWVPSGIRMASSRSRWKEASGSGGRAGAGVSRRA